MTSYDAMHAKLIRLVKDYRRLTLPAVEKYQELQRVASSLNRILGPSATSSNSLMMFNRLLDPSGPMVSPAANDVRRILGITERILTETESTRHVLRALNLENSYWARLVPQITKGPVSYLMGASSVSWTGSVSTYLDRINCTGLTQSHPSLTRNMLEPYLAYSRFARKTLNYMQIPSHVGEVPALRASLMLASSQLRQSASFLAEVMDAPDEEDCLESLPVLVAPKVQQVELIKANIPDDIEYDKILELSPTAATIQKCLRVLQLSIDCNRSAELNGRAEIFKPTTALLEAFAFLPHTAVVSRKTFGDFVDGIYALLYESVGRDNLRYLTDGYVTRSQCEVVWAVKHLRNKYLRHDPDHGDSSSIKKSWQELRESLKWLGLPHLPVSIGDFRFLQDRILEETERLLSQILHDMQSDKTEA